MLYMLCILISRVAVTQLLNLKQVLEVDNNKNGSSAEQQEKSTIACGTRQSHGLGSLILLPLLVGINTKTREDHGWERHHCVNT